MNDSIVHDPVHLTKHLAEVLQRHHPLGVIRPVLSIIAQYGLRVAASVSCLYAQYEVRPLSVMLCAIRDDHLVFFKHSDGGFFHRFNHRTNEFTMCSNHFTASVGGWWTIDPRNANRLICSNAVAVLSVDLTNGTSTELMPSGINTRCTSRVGDYPKRTVPRGVHFNAVGDTLYLMDLAFGYRFQEQMNGSPLTFVKSANERTPDMAWRSSDVEFPAVGTLFALDPDTGLIQKKTILPKHMAPNHFALHEKAVYVLLERGIGTLAVVDGQEQFSAVPFTESSCHGTINEIACLRNNLLIGTSDSSAQGGALWGIDPVTGRTLKLAGRNKSLSNRSERTLVRKALRTGTKQSHPHLSRVHRPLLTADEQTVYFSDTLGICRLVLSSEWQDEVLGRNV